MNQLEKEIHTYKLSLNAIGLKNNRVGHKMDRVGHKNYKSIRVIIIFGV